VTLLTAVGLGVFWRDLAHSAVWCRVLFVIAIVLLVWCLIRHRKHIVEYLKKDEPSGGGFRVFHLQDNASISGSDVRTTIVQAGATPPVPVAPPQVETSEVERKSLGDEIVAVGELIRDLTKVWPLPVTVAIEQTGSTDPQVFQPFRRRYADELQERYRREFRPVVMDVYDRARVRGYFDPEAEEKFEVSTIPGALDLYPRLLALGTRYS
jgi:hypothetical protein